VTGGPGTVGSVFNKILLAQVPHSQSLITSYRNPDSPVKRLPDSVQAVGEACQRIMNYRAGEHLHIIRPFKKLVPAYLGDISRALIRASAYEIEDGVKPLFTVASQASYLKVDELLRTVAQSYNQVTGQAVEYDIEELVRDDPPDFTYDLSEFRNVLLRDA